MRILYFGIIFVLGVVSVTGGESARLQMGDEPLPGEDGAQVPPGVEDGDDGSDDGDDGGEGGEGGELDNQVQDQQPMIFDGVVVEPFSKPYVAALFYQGTFACAAGLVGDYWLITAAQCVYAFKDVALLPNWTVELPRHNISDTADFENSYVLEIEYIYCHPYFDATSLFNDIAIIKLKKRVTKFEYLYIPYYDTHIYDPFFVFGWGMVAAATFSDVLRQALIEKEPCDWPSNPVFPLFNQLAPEHQYQLICGAGEPTPAGTIPDACFGDQGSPLVMPEDDFPYTKYLIGVASLIIPTPLCGQGNSIGYQSILAHLGWIEYVIYGYPLELPFEEITCGESDYGDTMDNYDIFDSVAGDKFYNFYLPGDPNTTYYVEVDNCRADYDSWIYITELYNVKEILCEDDDNDFCGDRSKFSCYLYGGQYYTLIISGFRAEEGNFDFDITCDQCFQSHMGFSVNGATRIYDVYYPEDCCYECYDYEYCYYWTWNENRYVCYLIDDPYALPKNSNVYWASKPPQPLHDAVGQYWGTSYKSRAIILPTSDACDLWCYNDYYGGEGRCKRWNYDKKYKRCWPLDVDFGINPNPPVGWMRGWIVLG